MNIVDWLREKITRDPRALQWFEGPQCEDRIARAYRELVAGYELDTSKILNETRPVTGHHSGSVTVRDINYYSLCAHHFLPFFGKVTITYQPGSKIIGLGKFPRLVQAFARRFQIQEDLVKDIAEEVMRSGEAAGVFVTASGRHMCMCSRGPSDSDVVTDTTYALGTLAGPRD